MTVLICVCFQYTGQKRLESSRYDADNVRNIFFYSKTILFTDSTDIQSYNNIYLNPTKKLFIDIVRQESKNEQVMIYITGHGVCSGFVWYDMSCLELSSLQQSIQTDYICVVDTCNTGSMNLDYSYSSETEAWLLNGSKDSDKVCLYIGSSTKGINSKMRQDGSVFSSSLFKMFDKQKPIKNIIATLSKTFTNCTVESSTYDWSDIENLYNKLKTYHI